VEVVVVVEEEEAAGTQSSGRSSSSTSRPGKEGRMDASLRLIDERKDDAMVLFWFSVLDSGERIFLPDSFYFCPPFCNCPYRWNDNILTASY
jgi:hypothetical protein